MKNPAQVLFHEQRLRSIGKVERRLAVIQEMQRLLGNRGVPDDPSAARKSTEQPRARTNSGSTSKT